MKAPAGVLTGRRRRRFDVMKLLVTDPVPRSLIDWFGSMMPAGVEMDCVADESDAEFARRAADAEILLATGRRIDAALLALAPRARFVQRSGVGYDNLDVAALNAAGVPAAYCPRANVVPVAEHTVMLMLVLVKHFVIAEQGTRAGRWPAMEVTQLGIGDLAGATVGLVGLGNIGQAVAERLTCFGARLLYTARRRVVAAEERLGVRFLPLEELLAGSNIVSLHLPLTPETQGIIGAAQLARMPAGALLINTARGGLVDEAALRAALLSGHLAGAGLDVLENEAEGVHPFADLPQVIATPHIAGASRGSIVAVAAQTCENIGHFVRGEPLQDLVPGTTAGRA
jgi:D-3-phosphoglycerate dehydrogenase